MATDTTVTIEGHSDDILQVVGGPFSEEFPAYSDAKYLRFSDGTIIRGEYSPEGYSGKWKIERVKIGTASYEHTSAKNDDDDYSDIVTLQGNLEWVQCGESETPTRKELVEWAQEFDWSDCDADCLSEIRVMAEKNARS